MFSLQTASFTTLERTLDAAALRQRVIAGNIANVDTPRFKRSEVRFEELLENELAASPSLKAYRTDSRHIAFGSKGQAYTPQIYTNEQSVVNNSLNNVDIDYEMALLAKNQLRYNVLIEQLNGEFKKVRTALDGRR